MAYILMAYIVMAYVFTAHLGMAWGGPSVLSAFNSVGVPSSGVNRCGLHSYGLDFEILSAQFRHQFRQPSFCGLHTYGLHSYGLFSYGPDLEILGVHKFVGHPFLSVPFSGRPLILNHPI